jgi:predicted PurR-regulated permease PerM
MDAPASNEPDPPSLFSLGDRAGGLIATATVLGLLYLGRDVLVPITLAIILSLLIAPLVRLLRQGGLGQTVSVLVAVGALALLFTAATVVVAMQMVKMSANLPRYEKTIRNKLITLDDLTVGRLNLLDGGVRRRVTQSAPGSVATGPATTLQGVTGPAAPIPVEVHNPPPDSFEVLGKVVGSIWVPLETAGIVLVVLVFVLLEHEAVRDRFIRIAGGTDIRATTLALNDAGERLSRFFVSQFLVNLGVGAAVGAGLMIIGLPHALLWGALAGVLRFVPYVGVWIAALCATLLGAAVDPGWTLATLTLGLFVIIELIAGQLVEPQLYGHTTGLSPLSVVLAAIFWSWLWGPTGLIVSTPLTLCLVVAGRHIKALRLLDVLLGDTQALTMPQRFYQRALSFDSHEIIESARAFLKRNSFASYCDLVLMPALLMARLDVDSGAITSEQLSKVREVIASVIAGLGGRTRRFPYRPVRSSVLEETNVGRMLRMQREQIAGPFQGPLSVPPGSVMLCIGLGSLPDDLAAELLVRALREQKIDARHISLDELRAPPPPEASAADLSIVYLVSAFPSPERDHADAIAALVRQRLPGVCLVTVFLPGVALQAGTSLDSIRGADKAATSFGHAVQICLNRQEDTRKGKPVSLGSVT